MKMAICGGGPLAIELTLFISYRLEANATLYFKNELGGQLGRLKDNWPSFKLSENKKDYVSSWGREFHEKQLNNKRLHEFLEVEGPLTAIDYWEYYLRPIIENSEFKALTKKANVLRVQKRFLSFDETIPSKSRLEDLFRVTFSQDMEENLNELLKLDIDVNKILGQGGIEELKETVEYFEDYDLVADARGPFVVPNKMGPAGGLALNEFRFLNDHPKVTYGLSKIFNTFINELADIILVGSFEESVSFLLFNKDILFQNENLSLSIVTNEREGFQHYFRTTKDKNKLTEFKELLESFAKKNTQRYECYLEQEKKWLSLEDYEKAKIKRPVPPLKMPTIYEGYNVISIDEMSNLNQLFLTIETPVFRNGKEELKTLKADHVIVLNGFKTDNSIFNDLQVKTNEDTLFHDEPGLYTLRGNQPEVIKNIELLGQNILNFFKRAGV